MTAVSHQLGVNAGFNFSLAVSGDSNFSPGTTAGMVDFEALTPLVDYFLVQEYGGHLGSSSSGGSSSSSSSGGGGASGSSHLVAGPDESLGAENAFFGSHFVLETEYLETDSGLGKAEKRGVVCR
jgi:hypothetical protein